MARLAKGRGRRNLQHAAWLQVTCCTSLACLVIKRIIISCGIQPKKINKENPHPLAAPAATSSSLCLCPPPIPACIAACIFSRNEKRERDATRSRQKGFSPDQKDAMLLWGMVCNCDQYRVLLLLLYSNPVPPGQQAVAVYEMKSPRLVSLPGGGTHT